MEPSGGACSGRESAYRSGIRSTGRAQESGRGGSREINTGFDERDVRNITGRNEEPGLSGDQRSGARKLH
jgi:hypothetical protein